MSDQSAETLMLAAIIEERRRQKEANKEKETEDEPIIPEWLQRAFNDL